MHESSVQFQDSRVYTNLQVCQVSRLYMCICCCIFRITSFLDRLFTVMVGYLTDEIIPLKKLLNGCVYKTSYLKSGHICNL